MAKNNLADQHKGQANAKQAERPSTAAGSVTRTAGDDANRMRTTQPAAGTVVKVFDYEPPKNDFTCSTPFVPVAVLTTGFNSDTDADSDCQLVKPDGTTDGTTLHVDRFGADFWPYWPSTLFNPDPSNPKANFGIVYVTEDALKQATPNPNDYIWGGKWPLLLGDKLDDLVARLLKVESTQEVVAGSPLAKLLAATQAYLDSTKETK